MISYDRFLDIVRQSDHTVQQAADQAFQRLLEKIRQRTPPRTAIAQVMTEFNADTLEGFAEAFSAVLESSLGVKELKDWPVGGVKLSQRLYQNTQQVSATTRTIIEQHMKGLHNAQELRKALYEGYDFQQDPLEIIYPLPKYLQSTFAKFQAAQLKTPALRAAYLAAIQKMEAGAGMEALEKALRVAFYERNRYFANRIARTELHRSYTDQQAREWMDADWVEYVEISLSGKHPKTDICDYHAKVDLYGLGAGVYPKAVAPKPPFHPHCFCLSAPRIDLINPNPKFNPKEEKTFLASLPAKEAAQIAGSFEKRKRILEGEESLEGIYNMGKDELYRWRRVSDVLALPNTAIPQVPINRIGAQVLNGTLSMSPLLEARTVDAYLRQPENLAALTQEFTDWGSHWLDELDAAIAAKAAGQKYAIKTTGELRNVGALSEQLVEKLEQRGLTPYSAVLSVRDQDVIHAFREAKVGEVSRAWYLRLPEHLREPKAVLLDTTHERPALLYVYDVEGQTAKLVVEIDYLVSERGKDGRKITRPANVVGTGRFVPLANLKKSYGKPLEGTL